MKQDPILKQIKRLYGENNFHIPVLPEYACRFLLNAGVTLTHTNADLDLVLICTQTENSC